MTAKSTRRAAKRASTSDRQKTAKKRTSVKANALYRELFASSPDGILLIDHETQRVIEFNDAACRQLGYPREEFSGLRILDYETSETPDAINAHVQKALREGKSEFDTLQRTKTGEIRNVHVWAKRFHLDGRVVFHAIFRDVTERNRSEEALRNSENRYRTLVDNLPQRVFLKDRNSAYVSMNELYARDLNVKAVEAAGKTDYDFFPKELAEKYRADDARIMSSGRMEEIDEEYIQDGQRLTIHTVKTPVTDEQGSTTGVLGIFWDITEQKRVEDALTLERVALRESEARFRELSENIQEVFWITNADMDEVLFVSPAYESIWGRTRQSLYESPRNWLDAISPEDHDRVLQATVTMIETRGTYDEEYRILQSNGAERWIRDRAFSVRDDDGAVKRRVGIAEDITERKRAEETLREAEARYRLLFEQSPYGVLLLDAETRRVIEANATAAAQLGYTREEFVALAIADYEVLETPEDTERRVRKLLREGADDFDTVHRTKSGELRDVHVWIQVVSLMGRRCFHVIFRDITESNRKDESERLQSAALHAAADAIVITDRAGVIEWVNPAFTQLTGYTVEEALGKHHRDLVKSGKHDRAFYKELWETILAGRTWHGEIINRRKDGSLYTDAQSITPVLGELGAVTHFVAIQKDITERLQLEAQFRQAQRMDSVGQLASGIAHDFNNLLTVINGTSELLLAHIHPDDPVHVDVQEIHGAGERAAMLTRQLLAFSRQQILEPRVLNFNTAVAGMESLLRRLLGEDIDLVVVPTPGLGSVKADPGQIDQVITNLAVNARDAMPQGGRLTIETENVTIDEDYARQHSVAVPPGPYVMLSVSDSGVGMDEATRARIFEPFFTTKGPGKGTGLGLSTVYGIVKQSQGFIWVYSEVGQGTRFRIYLPQVSEAADTDRPEPTLVSSSGTETILFAEDHAGLRKLATRMLESAGYTVLGAASGEEALRLLERYEAPVHLLFSDVVMPGMGGRELAERAAETHPAMKVLFMSGYMSDTILRHGVLEAKVSFLSKPFTAAELLRKVREVLDSQ